MRVEKDVLTLMACRSDEIPATARPSPPMRVNKVFAAAARIDGEPTEHKHTASDARSAAWKAVFAFGNDGNITNGPMPKYARGFDARGSRGQVATFEVIDSKQAHQLAAALVKQHCSIILPRKKDRAQQLAAGARSEFDRALVWRNPAEELCEEAVVVSKALTTDMAPAFFTGVGGVSVAL